MNRSDGQLDEVFGTTPAYTRAFRTVLAEGVPPKHLAMLREHYLAPKHTTTWEALAEKVGYRNGGAVQLQFGKFAGRIAHELGLHEPPQGFWLYVLAKWAPTKDNRGHTRFTLRAPVREAIKELGMI